MADGCTSGQSPRLVHRACKALVSSDCWNPHLPSEASSTLYSQSSPLREMGIAPVSMVWLQPESNLQKPLAPSPYSQMPEPYEPEDQAGVRVSMAGSGPPLGPHTPRVSHCKAVVTLGYHCVNTVLALTPQFSPSLGG